MWATSGKSLRQAFSDSRFSPVDLSASRFILSVLAAAFMVLGAKIWVIATSGSPTPFWDQWDGEAAFLYKPYIESKLTWSDLFASHNEHRIFLTRLLALALLELAGHWDPILQMIFNACLHVVFLIVLIVVCAKIVPPPLHVGFCVFSGLMFAIPFGWENTLAGFQSQFYLLLIFSVLALATIMTAPALGTRWWLGTAIGVTSVLTVSSGVLTLVPAIVLRALQMLIRVRRGRNELFGLLIHLVAVVALSFTVATVPGHAALKAQTLNQFMTALWTISGWPIPFHWLSPFIVFLPMLILFALALIRRPSFSDQAWVSLAVGLWVVAQLMSLAYGRAVGILGSRYLDIVVVGLIVNSAAAAMLYVELAHKWTFPSLLAVIIGSWSAVICFHLANAAVSRLPAEIALRKSTGAIQTENVQEFLRSGDRAALDGKPILHIPYPSAERLAMLLGDQTIRMILPPELAADVTNGRKTNDKLVLKGRFSRFIAKLRNVLLGAPLLLVSLACALFVWLIPAISINRQTSDPDTPQSR